MYVYIHMYLFFDTRTHQYTYKEPIIYFNLIMNMKSISHRIGRSSFDVSTFPKLPRKPPKGQALNLRITYGRPLIKPRVYSQF